MTINFTHPVYIEFSKSTLLNVQFISYSRHIFRGKKNATVSVPKDTYFDFSTANKKTIDTYYCRSRFHDVHRQNMLAILLLDFQFRALEFSRNEPRQLK